MSTQPECVADLSALVRSSAGEDDRYEAHIAGGGRTVRRPSVVMSNVEARHVGQGVVLQAEFVERPPQPAGVQDQAPAVSVELTPTAAGLPVDWRDWQTLQVDLESTGPPVEVELTIVGSRSRLSRRQLLEDGPAMVALDLADLPLIQGIQPSNAPQAVRLALRFADDGRERTVTLRRLALVGRRTPGPVLDRFGQRIGADWPGKIRSEEELRAAAEAEARQLDSAPAFPDRGRFGGWTGGPRLAATGFFRVERDDGGRWWYADPEGLPFWSFGSCCVTLGDNTPVVGREHLFAELPDRERLPEAWDEAGHVRFYAANAIRKYGSPEAWGRRQRRRLLAWGATTVANWSDVARVGGAGLPYVKTLSSRTPENIRRFGGFPDVCDPDWEPMLRERFAAEAAPLRDDPWLIGYFVDNEMPWGRLPPEQVGDLAERYFAGVSRALKAADPNHLYLGCRFVRVMPDEAIPAVAGRYVDVLSVNAYSIVPLREDFDRWYDLARRPIQIGEHQLALWDVRQPPPLWTAFTAQERSTWLPAYDRTAASLPYCIGSHWFQFVDQAGTGRASNGENMLIGLVDIADQPYGHMVEAFGQIGREMYGWHANAVDGGA